MRQPRGLRRALVLVVLAVLAGGFYAGGRSAPEIDPTQLAASALARTDAATYVAEVVTVTRHEGKLLTARARVYRRGASERIEYSEEPGAGVWSITRDGRSYTFLPAEDRLLISETDHLLSTSDREKLLLSNYRAVYSGAESVAGREAHVVDLTPRRSGRPRKRLWIDARRQTVLRSVDYSSGGDRRGSMRVARIRYDAPVPDKMFTVPRNARVQRVNVCASVRRGDLAKVLGFGVSLPGYVPKGYVLEGVHLFTSQCNCRHKAAQLNYTDGLNVISIFQAPRMTNCDPEVCNMRDDDDGSGCRMGGCEMARMGQVSRGNKVVVVVGDLLSGDIKRIAESVR